jgi:hypothetical protein
MVSKNVIREEAHPDAAGQALDASHPEVVEDSLSGFRPVQTIDLFTALVFNHSEGPVQLLTIPSLKRLALYQGSHGIDIPTDYSGTKLGSLHQCGSRAGEGIKDS